MTIPLAIITEWRVSARSKKMSISIAIETMFLKKNIAIETL
jgi:hypothetical protein